ncbi:hypothetical protein DMENIID0001_101670 [Sergentomyia squamirostris]
MRKVYFVVVLLAILEVSLAENSASKGEKWKLDDVEKEDILRKELIELARIKRVPISVLFTILDGKASCESVSHGDSENLDRLSYLVKKVQTEIAGHHHPNPCPCSTCAKKEELDYLLEKFKHLSSMIDQEKDGKHHDYATFVDHKHLPEQPSHHAHNPTIISTAPVHHHEPKHEMNKEFLGMVPFKEHHSDVKPIEIIPINQPKYKPEVIEKEYEKPVIIANTKDSHSPAYHVVPVKDHTHSKPQYDNLQPIKEKPVVLPTEPVYKPSHATHPSEKVHEKPIVISSVPSHEYKEPHYQNVPVKHNEGEKPVVITDAPAHQSEFKPSVEKHPHYERPVVIASVPDYHKEEHMKVIDSLPHYVPEKEIHRHVASVTDHYSHVSQHQGIPSIKEHSIEKPVQISYKHPEREYERPKIIASEPGQTHTPHYSGVPVKEYGSGEKPTVLASVVIHQPAYQPVPEHEKPIISHSQTYPTKEYEGHIHKAPQYSGIPMKEHGSTVIASAPAHHSEYKPVPATFPEPEHEKPMISHSYPTKEYEGQIHKAPQYSGIPMKEHGSTVIASTPAHHSEYKPVPATFPEPEHEKSIMSHSQTYPTKEYEGRMHKAPQYSGIPMKEHGSTVIASTPAHHSEYKPVPAKLPEPEHEKPMISHSYPTKEYEGQPVPAKYPEPEHEKPMISHSYPTKEYEGQVHKAPQYSNIPIKEHGSTVIASAPAHHSEYKPVPATFPEPEHEKPMTSHSYPTKEYEGQVHKAPQYSNIPIKEHGSTVIASAPAHHSEYKPVPAKYPEPEHEKPMLSHLYPTKEYEGQVHKAPQYSNIPIKEHGSTVIANAPAHHSEYKPVPATFPEPEHEKPMTSHSYPTKEYEGQVHKAPQYSGIPMKERGSTVIASSPAHHSEYKPVPAKLPEPEHEKPIMSHSQIYPTKEYEGHVHKAPQYSSIPIKEHSSTVIASAPAHHSEYKPMPDKSPEPEYEKPAQEYHAPQYRDIPMKHYESEKPKRLQETYHEPAPHHGSYPTVDHYSKQEHEKPYSYVKAEEVPILPPHSHNLYTDHKPIPSDDVEYQVYKRYPGYTPVESEYDKNERIKETVNDYIKSHWTVMDNPHDEVVNMHEDQSTDMPADKFFRDDDVIFIHIINKC